MKKVLRSTGQPASLPIGWHRWFLGLFFGDTKGVYTNWPGPVPDAYSCLSFLGLTFTKFQQRDDEPCWTKNLRVPGKDQSWTGPVLEATTDDETSDTKLAVIIETTETQDFRKPRTPSPPRKKQHESPRLRRRHTVSVSIQPDEVVEPSDGLGSKGEEPAQPTARDGFPDHQAERPRRRERRSTNGIHGRNQRQYFMETTATNEPPDSSVFDETASEFIPLQTESPRYKARKPRRRSSMNSSVSTQSDSLPRAPSPPREGFSDINIPATPSPRKSQRRTSGPSSPASSTRFRNLSPINDYNIRGDLSDSYMPTPDSSSQVSWSGYASPPLPPMPSSPGSTLSYSSRQSFLSTPPSTIDEVVENVNGEFTVKLIRSVSDTPEGRYYKVRWANTWESKASMRAATESGKYTVKEILESRYVNGKGLYHARWEDTWESEQELGDIEPVRAFWSGERRHQ
ncbi:hypothetical protein AA313_de0202484 [Arthrobotrys entomopaga]|nr:hypothetical protein AA313_de0202484 [Arthrobotrys entomopaga]